MKNLRDLQWAALSLGAGAVLFVLGQCSGRSAGVEQERTRIAEENAQKALLAYRATRDSIPALVNTAMIRNTAKVRVRNAGLAVILHADSVTADNRAFLNAERDSVSGAVPMDTASRSAFTNRLLAQIATTDSLAAAFRAYVRADMVADSADAELHRGYTLALARADTALAANRVLIDALRKRECRILGLPCPSRKTVFLAGAVTGSILLVRIAR